jgi:hypothetical protein
VVGASFGYRRRIGAARIPSATSAVARWSCCAALLVGLVACSDDDGEPVIDLGASAVGTCLDFGDEVGADVERLPEVPCEDPHTHEIFAVVDSSNETYPGFEALEAEAQAACFEPFEDYVGISAFDSELFYSWLVPTLTSWEQDDDREIVCVAGENNGAPLVGSVRGLAR